MCDSQDPDLIARWVAQHRLLHHLAALLVSPLFSCTQREAGHPDLDRLERPRFKRARQKFDRPLPRIWVRGSISTVVDVLQRKSHKGIVIT